MYSWRVRSADQAPPPFVRLAGHPVRWRLLAELARSDRRVRELVAAVDQPQNLVSYHLRLLRAGGLVASRRSSFDGRDSYYHLDLAHCADALIDAGAVLHPALRLHLTPAAAHPARCRVLFLCTGNSARSPMAEALLRYRTGDWMQVASAGSHPKPRLHPNAVRVMHEDYGINLGNRQPHHVDAAARREFDYVISLCDKVREACPEINGSPQLVHWSMSDPAAAAGTDQDSYPAFRHTAAQLDTRIRFLLPVLATRDREE